MTPNSPAKDCHGSSFESSVKKEDPPDMIVIPDSPVKGIGGSDSIGVHASMKLKDDDLLHQKVHSKETALHLLKRFKDPCGTHQSIAISGGSNNANASQYNRPLPATACTISAGNNDAIASQYNMPLLPAASTIRAGNNDANTSQYNIPLPAASTIRAGNNDAIGSQYNMPLLPAASTIRAGNNDANTSQYNIPLPAASTIRAGNNDAIGSQYNMPLLPAASTIRAGNNDANTSQYNIPLPAASTIRAGNNDAIGSQYNMPLLPAASTIRAGNNDAIASQYNRPLLPAASTIRAGNNDAIGSQYNRPLLPAASTIRAGNNDAIASQYNRPLLPATSTIRAGNNDAIASQYNRVKKCAGCPFPFRDPNGPPFIGLVIQHKERDQYRDAHEAAKKEAERVQLEAEYKAAAAVSKIYEDASKEEREQYLGSDDPDYEDHHKDDVPQAHVVFEYVWGDNPQKQPYATKTPFGWCVAGPSEIKDGESKPIALSIFEFDVSQEVSSVNLERQVEKFWALEQHGFANPDESKNSVEDKKALEIFQETTKLKDGRYEVGLLWNTKDPHLPNNRTQAERRLQQLKRRFVRDSEFAARYKAVMEEYISKGYAKKLSDEEAARTSEKTWYLPHHGVTNPNKAKLNNSLIGVLMRFRKERIAVSSDIESMFHRVACREEDTDALRFLWWNGNEDEPSDYKMTVHLFGKADSPCISSLALKRTAIDNEADFDREVSEIVHNNFYVDDCLFSKPTVEEAVNLSLQLMQLLKKGNFRLTKFASSDKHVLSSIPAEERTIKDLDLDKLPVERALGVQWDIKNDTFGVKVSAQPKQLNDNTRRACLSTISSTFDPLGMISPVLLPAKRIVQKTWQLKLNWDDQLPEDLLEALEKWKEELPLLTQVNIPRCYFVNGCTTGAAFQLHHFCDASEYGYGTVSYLRKEAANGTVECAFITSKSRTAPLQYVSIPRLELQAATIAVRVHSMIVKEINLTISSAFFWTDSRIVIQYINNESRRFKTYVANRVAEIRCASQPDQWRHCPGLMNPADDASRGLSAQALLDSERWFTGPAFLLETEPEWPSLEIEALPESDPECYVLNCYVLNVHCYVLNCYVLNVHVLVVLCTKYVHCYVLNCYVLNCYVLNVHVLVVLCTKLLCTKCECPCSVMRVMY
ncbi:hypothetical protein QZH41_000800 [Actinostola sp. cb2023]|nr:hypothetical protein QZH41_000800 [Actinostola sp. cb2023]